MYTLNKIVKLIDDWTATHLQINDFVFDFEYSYESDDALKYPCLLADLIDSPFNEQKPSAVWEDGFNFKIQILDLVREDKSNELEVLSDCKLMMNDLLFYLRLTNFTERLTIDTTGTMKPVRLVGTNFVSGWEQSIHIKFVTDPDLCGIPTT